MQCRVFIFHKNRGKISSFFGFYEEIIPRIWPKGFCVLFVRNHQALRLSVACLDEIDAVLVLGGRDNQLCFIGEEGFDFLSQCVVKAYFAKVFASEGHAFVGPLLAGGIAVDVRNLDVEHIVHVAAHLGIRPCNVGRNHLALAASVEKEIDEDGLTSVEDFEEVVGLPVAVGDGEVNGLREWGLLCAKACAKEQER